MAVKFIEATGNGLIGFWDITETVDVLMELLQPDMQELAGFQLFRNESRKKEWLATRLLIRQMTGNTTRIGYDSAGKPLLLNTPGHISITHTSGRVAIFFHRELHPGIDIELISRNTERAAKKFLSEVELNDCTVGGVLSNTDLLLRWCAKEAVFKMVPFKEIDFASQITCQAEPFTKPEGEMSAIFMHESLKLPIPLHYRQTGEILMVWGAISPGYQTSSSPR